MFSGGGGYGSKIDAEVDFPLEGLDLTDHVISKEQQADGKRLIYDLYAVSNHYGNMGFGHYRAYAQSPIADKWFEFDDSRVSSISPSQLKN